MSYEAVPDVEEGDGGLPPSDVLIKAAQERYPEAGTELEAEFLGRLDDAIDNAKPTVSFPRLSVEQLQSGGSGHGGADLGDLIAFAKTLKLPTIAFAITAVSGLVVIVANSAVIRAIYPYYACILTFAASIPDIRKRFLESIAPVFDRLQSVKDGTERKVEGIADKGLNYLGITEKAMNNALAPIKDKLSLATKLETMLKKINPDIDIPDTTDIEKSFDGYEDTLKSGFEGLQGVADLSRSLPAPLQSIAKFQVYIVAPFLAVMLILQLIGAYHISQGMQEESVVADDYVAVNETSFRSLATNSTDLDSSVIESVAKDWSLLWIAVQAYLTTASQVVLVFLVTQGRVIVAVANLNIARIEKSLNLRLKAAIGDTFEIIFEKGFGAVKTKFLDLVHKIDLIEQPLRKVQESIPGAGMLGKFLK